MADTNSFRFSSARNFLAQVAKGGVGAFGRNSSRRFLALKWMDVSFEIRARGEENGGVEVID